MNVAEKLQKRVSRTQKFLREKKPGTVLWIRQNIFDVGFEGHWVSRLMKQDVSELLDRRLISEWNDVYLKKLRAKYNELYSVDDDSVPTPEIYFTIGAVTSAMSGAPVHFTSDTGWCEPEIDDWEVLENLSAWQTLRIEDLCTPPDTSKSLPAT